jgi:hypothetical protein
VFVLDYFAYETVGPDLSYGAWPPDQTSYRQIFHYPTPRGINNPASPPATLFINEWMADNSRAVADPADGDFDDWFEIFNPGAEPVDLEGFTLTDALINPGKFAVPSGIVVPPQGYLLVWADEESSQTRTNGDLHVNFKLPQGGEAIGLFAPDGTPVDSVTFGQQTDNISQGRYPDGSVNLYFMPFPTPGAANLISEPLTPPELMNVRVEPGGFLSFSFVTQQGHSYQVEYTEDLSAPEWLLLGPAYPGTGLPVMVTDPVGAGPCRFYRVVVQPQ